MVVWLSAIGTKWLEKRLKNYKININSKQMTKQQLEKMEIFHDPSRTIINRYWSNVGQFHLTLHSLKDLTPVDVCQMIYRQGILEGVEIGKAEKSKEIRKALGCQL